MLLTRLKSSDAPKPRSIGAIGCVRLLRARLRWWRQLRRQCLRRRGCHVVHDSVELASNNTFELKRCGPKRDNRLNSFPEHRTAAS